MSLREIVVEDTDGSYARYFRIEDGVAIEFYDEDGNAIEVFGYSLDAQDIAWLTALLPDHAKASA